ncbi:MAG: ligD [Massilia sp.]|nr:ligD [Massilia sp.]
MNDALKAYKEKRNFDITSEPAEGGEAGTDALSFVIQKHWASRLHYDFRLELDGTMKSWAVPKGPSYDTHDKRMAVQVEDHPIAYSSFEGTIPEKQYGAGKVIIWDKGTWTPLGDARAGYEAGNLKFELHGHKMHGKWALIRMKDKGEKQPPWLLIKEKDDYVRPASEFSVVDEMPDSVKSLKEPNSAKAGKEVKESKAKKAKEKAPAADLDAPVDFDAVEHTGTPPEGAVEAKLPAEFKPELATLVDMAPGDPEDWVFEIKFDGYRMLTRVESGKIQLITRNNNDWTAKLMPLHDELARMQLPDGWYDGEIVVHDEDGKPDFGLLQTAFDGSNTARIMYFLFDVPYLHGYDLRECALVHRRAALHNVLNHLKSDIVRFSDEFGNDPQELVVAACRMGLEGVIGKRRDSRYVQRRSPDWIKLKCGKRQEFVIGGYTDPQGSRVGIGALLLGTHDENGVLQYAGNVGTGFNARVLRELKEKLSALDTDVSPFPPRAVAGRKHHWVKPVLLCEISFAEWTRDGAVRHAVFHGLREDKPAKAITREVPKHIEANVKSSSKKTSSEPEAPEGKLPADFKVSNGDRVIDAQSGATKLDMVRYYALVGSLMMEQLKDRPVSLVRAPAGVGGELFFQKHADIAKLPGVKQLPQELDPEHPPMLVIGNELGLLSAAQFNVVEFHSQNAVGKNYEKPDRMVFDLDPGEGVEWKTMQEAGQLMKAFLDELGLASFVKTSGGKGLHVVVPIKPQYGWDDVKAFSQEIVSHMAITLPDRFAFKSGPKNRVGKIFIDYLRNGRGATTAAAWSARTRPGLGISVPISWEELEHVKAGDQWNIKNVQSRLDQGNAPWAEYAKSAKSLTAAMKQLGFKPAG